MEQYNAAAYKKAWRQAHTSHIKLYQKQYLEKNNVLVQCEVCSGRYKKYNKAIHLNSDKHLRTIKTEADLLSMMAMREHINELEATLSKK